MKFSFVGEARIVFWRSSASLLGMLAAVVGAFGAMQGHLPLLQPLIGTKLFAAVSLACDAAPTIATALAAAVPFARIVMQDRLRELTGAANPQPGVIHDTQ
jgi:hypothetical protein